jgi:hypothetical protein
MFEIEGHKSTIVGLGIGGISGFLLHKNLKISKGVGVAIGCVLGVVIGFQFTKSEAKKNREAEAKAFYEKSLAEKNKLIAEGKMTTSGEKVVK